MKLTPTQFASAKLVIVNKAELVQNLPSFFKDLSYERYLAYREKFDLIESQSSHPTLCHIDIEHPVMLLWSEASVQENCITGEATIEDFGPDVDGRCTIDPLHDLIEEEDLFFFEGLGENMKDGSVEQEVVEMLK